MSSPTIPTFEYIKENYCAKDNYGIFYKLDENGTTHMINCMSGTPLSYTVFKKWNSPDTDVSYSYDALTYCREIFEEGNTLTHNPREYTSTNGKKFFDCTKSTGFQMMFDLNPRSFGESLITGHRYESNAIIYART